MHNISRFCIFVNRYKSSYGMPIQHTNPTHRIYLKLDMNGCKIDINHGIRNTQIYVYYGFGRWRYAFVLWMGHGGAHSRAMRDFRARLNATHSHSHSSPTSINLLADGYSCEDVWNEDSVLFFVDGSEEKL